MYITRKIHLISSNSLKINKHNQWLYIWVCVCACVCACVIARACVCVCVKKKQKTIFLPLFCFYISTQMLIFVSLKSAQLVMYRHILTRVLFYLFFSFNNSLFAIHLYS